MIPPRRLHLVAGLWRKSNYPFPLAFFVTLTFQFTPKPLSPLKQKRDFWRRNQLWRVELAFMRCWNAVRRENNNKTLCFLKKLSISLCKFLKASAQSRRKFHLRKRKKARASSREKRDFCLNGSDENKLLRALKTTGKRRAEEEANKKKVQQEQNLW